MADNADKIDPSVYYVDIAAMFPHFTPEQIAEAQATANAVIDEWVSQGMPDATEEEEAVFLQNGNSIVVMQPPLEIPG